MRRVMLFLPLLIVPVSLLLGFVVHAGPVWIFVTAAAATAVLADWVRRATEQLADRVGGAIGGLLNVSFGSIAELVLALFVLEQGHAAVVQAQVTGSIIGTGLLGLGLAMLVGGLGREKQHFNRATIGLLSTLLILVLITLLLPAISDATHRQATQGGGVGLGDERLSIAASLVMLVLYGANLVYTLVTHRDMFGRAEESEGEGGGHVPWSLGRALAVLVIGTVVITAEAELVSDALAAASAAVGLPQTFVGIVVLALVGTAADLFAAVVFARQDRMTIVFSVCIGSAIQMAMVVAPVLVIASWALGHPMTLVFGPLELLAIGGTALVVRAISADGETTWYEGLLLVGLYGLLAMGFLLTAGPSG
jgi:Ca2+:H+ antiporter